MALNNKQKSFVDKNYTKYTAPELANKINSSRGEVYDYIYYQRKKGNYKNAEEEQKGIDFLKKYGKHELERFAYLRIYKKFTPNEMKKMFHNIGKKECQKLGSFIKNNPEYKVWE